MAWLIKPGRKPEGTGLTTPPRRARERVWRVVQKVLSLAAAKTTSISIQAWQRMAEKKKVDYTAIQAANERGSLGITDICSRVSNLIRLRM
mgnify:CR=1 FL=1